jgi:hypothetical protein
MASLAILAAGCSRPPDQPGVVVQGERLAVVDMHLHTGTWESMTPRFQERVAERVPRALHWIILAMPYMLGSARSCAKSTMPASAPAGFALYSPHSTALPPTSSWLGRSGFRRTLLVLPACGWTSEHEWVRGAAKLEFDLAADNFVGEARPCPPAVSLRR